MSRPIKCQVLKANGSACCSYATHEDDQGRRVCFAHYRRGGRPFKEPLAKKLSGDSGAKIGRPKKGKNGLGKTKVQSKKLKRGKRQCDFLTKEGKRCRSQVLCKVENGQYACRTHWKEYRSSDEVKKEMEAKVISARVQEIAKAKQVKPVELDPDILEKAEMPTKITITGRSNPRSNTKMGENTVILGAVKVEIPVSFPERLEARIKMAWEKLAWMNAWLAKWNEEEERINTTETHGTQIVDGEPMDFRTITRRHATFAELAIKMMDAQTKAEKVLDDLLKQQQNLLITSVLLLEKMGYKFDHEAGMVMLADVEKARRQAQGTDLLTEDRYRLERPWPSDWDAGKTLAQVERDGQANMVPIKKGDSDDENENLQGL